jgi:hypothetical protein
MKLEGSTFIFSSKKKRSSLGKYAIKHRPVNKSNTWPDMGYSLKPLKLKRSTYEPNNKMTIPKAFKGYLCPFQNKAFSGVSIYKSARVYERSS